MGFCGIREAHIEDLPYLLPIEQAAAAQFRGTAYDAIAHSKPTTWTLDSPRFPIWVAVNEQDQPIAFAVVRLLAEGPHLQEIDVDPNYARQGIGRRLIEAIATWARNQGHTTLTLTTFRTIPWNAPYYTRLGFQILNDEELTPVLWAIRSAEADLGLSVGDRCCMRLDLSHFSLE